MDESSGFFETPARARSLSDGSFERISSNSESYCDIWRADKDGRFRVYKSLKAKYVGDPVYERLLRKEFEIGYSLKHQNICEYYSFVSIPPLGNCIEMEWVDGETLDSLLAREKMNKALTLRVLSEICDALEYMHSKQVVHRDLKPSNIMLTHNGGYVKLIDFGLSDSDSHSVLKGSAGTQLYASPEQLSGGEVDLRSDIYSLGCVIDRLCPTSSGVLPSRASSLRRIARKCTRRDPSRRFQTASEVRRALLNKSSFILVSAAAMLIVCVTALLALRPWQSSDAERLARPSANVPAGVSPSAVASPAAVSPSATISPSAAVPDSVQSVTSSTPPGAAGAVPRSAGSQSAGTSGVASGAAGSSQSAGRSQSGVSRSSASRSASASASRSGTSSKTSSSLSSATTSDQAAIDEIFRQATDLFGE